VVAPVLVGRVRELASLAAAVSAPPAVVCVEGEAGVGKTRLVGELLGRPELAGRAMLVGGCHPIRETFPLGPVVEALAGAEKRLPGRPLSGVAGAVRPLLPELAPWLPPELGPLDDRVAERHRVFRGLTEVLSALSPAVLVLEDLHWVDGQTSDFLAYLLAAAPAGLSVVLTYRSEQAGVGVRALTAKLPVGTSRAHVSLSPLDEAETGALSAAILGADQEVSEEFTRYVWERTSGLPFAVEEVLALVRERGLIVRHGQRWERRGLDRLEVPRSIRDSTLERVGRLPAGARRLAEAAAVLQSPVALPVLAAMTGSAGLTDAVEDAVSHGVLAETDATFGFRHALAAQAVYESLSSPRRLALHGRAAEALRALVPAPLGQVAHHLQHAGRPAEWAAAAQLAAGQAVALGHEDEAVRLLADVLRDARLAAEQRGTVAARLGWAALYTLHPRESVPLIQAALAANPPRPLRGELRFLLAGLLSQAGEDLLRQRQLFRDAIPDLGHRLDLRAWALMALGVTVPPEAPFTEAVRPLRDAVDLVGEIDDPLLRVLVLSKAGSFLMMIGDRGWRELADRVIRMTGSAPRRRREVNAYCTLGVVASYSGHLGTAQAMLNAGLAGEAVQHNRSLEIMLRSGLAVLRYVSGDWDGLADDVDRLQGEVTDYAPSRNDLDLVSGGLAIAEGRLDAAEALLRRVTRHAVEVAGYEFMPMAAGAWARASLARGDVAGAVACLQTLFTMLDAKGIWPSVGWALPAITETLLAVGRPGEAQRFIDRAGPQLSELDAPLAGAALSFASGLLHGRAEDLLAAADQYAALPARYEAARAREQAAALLLPAGDPQAAALLRDVVATYAQLGAERDRSRAAGLARDHEVPLPAVHRGGRRGYGATLSPRERQVARLAATGRTNKEIADVLFLSANTVGKHLAAAMRKLGVGSRTQLVYALAQPAGKDGVFSP
jgi:DNA-binding CsgD family transcriptional regulator